MECFLVTHTHWDREWYRTFQWFRARLVDAVDRVLDAMAADPGFRFHLDGQTVVLEDYLEIRPQRRPELERACRAGRLGIGPWYVQPDSLIPSGEAHVRNLLEGRRVGAAFGPLSSVAYTPDSFGHPAQFPQLFAGFGLGPFVYWRGNDDEIAALPAEYWWEAPDGTRVVAHHLWEGYFSAAGLPSEPDAAAAWLEGVARRLDARSGSGRVLLLNGVDHALPPLHTDAVAAALGQRTGWTVRRAVLDEFAQGLVAGDAVFRGELVGGRKANLLPGVWSARVPLKLRNRRCEALLEGWAEPWAALGRAAGSADEGAALRLAWRHLLHNQAHDSICGCSQDRVHEQMRPRYAAAAELARETTIRLLERLAGLDVDRETPWTQELDIAVFNPSPHPRTEVVSFALDPVPAFHQQGTSFDVHPLFAANLAVEGWTADGAPARNQEDPSTARQRPLPDLAPRTIEFVARDVPAFGWRRVPLRPTHARPDIVDEGREIAAGAVRVTAAADGTLTMCIDGRTYADLCGIEDVGDRGDTYDFDLAAGPAVRLAHVLTSRRRHPSGIETLTVRRVLAVPAGLAPGRERREVATVDLPLSVEARVAPGIDRVDLRVWVNNVARDHRLRLLFPTGAPAETFAAATTFDVTTRRTAPRPATEWVHPAPATFPQQGFVSANGLTVVAPGLVEAEVTPAGTIALTLVRSVGWLARVDLQSRRDAAGPTVPTPGAQCQETIEARVSLLGHADARAARDAELGLWAVAAGRTPLVQPGISLLTVEPRALVVSALKPADDGDGIVLRLLNPTDTARLARVRFGFAVAGSEAVRLDETPAAGEIRRDGEWLTFDVPPHALRSVRVRTRPA